MQLAGSVNEPRSRRQAARLRDYPDMGLRKPTCARRDVWAGMTIRLWVLGLGRLPTDNHAGSRLLIKQAPGRNMTTWPSGHEPGLQYRAPLRSSDRTEIASWLSFVESASCGHPRSS